MAVDQPSYFVLGDCRCESIRPEWKVLVEPRDAFASYADEGQKLLTDTRAKVKPRD